MVIIMQPSLIFAYACTMHIPINNKNWSDTGAAGAERGSPDRASTEPNKAKGSLPANSRSAFYPKV